MLQARQNAEVSLARAREENDTALHAAELQLLKAQDEAQQAHASAQSAASSVEQWKSRCGPDSLPPRQIFTFWQAHRGLCDWHWLQIQAAAVLILLLIPALICASTCQQALGLQAGPAACELMSKVSLMQMRGVGGACRGNAS